MSNDPASLLTDAYDRWCSAVALDDSQLAQEALQALYATGAELSAIYQRLFFSDVAVGHAATVATATKALQAELPRQAAADLAAVRYRAWLSDPAFWQDQQLVSPIPAKLDAFEAELYNDLKLQFPVTYVFLGGVHALRHEFNAAKGCYLAADGQVGQEIGWHSYDTGCRTFVPPVAPPPRGGRHPVYGAGTLIRANAPGPTVVFSGDSRYVRAFGPGILASAQLSGAGPNIHFHVINPTTETLAWLTENNVGISFEETSWTDTAYLALARFYKAAWFMDITGGDTAIFDLDIKFSAPLAPYFLAAGRNDVALTYNRGWARAYPWLNFNAGAVFFKASPMGREFAEFVSSAAELVFDWQSKRNWWCDQSLLFYSEHYFRKANPNAVFANNRKLPLPWKQDGAYKKATLRSFDAGLM